MKKERSMTLKMLFLLFEVLFGGSIFGAILTPFIGSTPVSILVVMLISYSLFTFLGIAYMKRKWVIRPEDGKILGIVLGLAILGSAYANTENIVYGIIAGVVVAGLTIFLLNKDDSKISTNVAPPQPNL